LALMDAGGNQPDLDLFLGGNVTSFVELGLGQRGVQRHRDVYGFSHVWLGWWLQATLPSDSSALVSEKAVAAVTHT
jgi:hypothetical protein